jgi:hypothetical protein
MNLYKSKVSSLPGTSYLEVLRAARIVYAKSTSRTKRQPYIRSSYFNKEKIFLSVFWIHIMQKDFKNRTKRLKLYASALDLLANTQQEPETIFQKNDLSVLLHRFYGVTADGVEFCVQVKQDKRTGRKDFMSVFDRKSSIN